MGQRVGWMGAVFGAVKFIDKPLPKSYHFFTRTLPEFNRQDLPGEELKPPMDANAREHAEVDTPARAGGSMVNGSLLMDWNACGSKGTD